MTNTRALLQQALNALEYHTQQTRTIHNTELAIDAIRAALAEPAPEREADDTMVICPNCVHQFRAIPVNVQSLLLAAGYEPPFTGIPCVSGAEPAPEPVAWIGPGGQLMSHEIYQAWARVEGDNAADYESLYAAPPPAAAIAPLTGHKIDKILDCERERWITAPPTYEFAYEFARAIERAHRIGASDE